MKRYFFFFCALCFFCVSGKCSELQPLGVHMTNEFQKKLSKRVIRICGSNTQWPPFHYIKNEKVIGFDIDLFDQILTKHGIKYEITLLSWNKCLAEVEKGAKFDIALGASVNKERIEKYHTSIGYYLLTPIILYKKGVKQNIEIIGSENYNQQSNLCGINGFNYSNFNQDNLKIERGADSYHQLILKTIYNRCYAFFTRLEIMRAWKNIYDFDFLNHPELEYSLVKNIERESFHLLISKNFLFHNEFRVYFQNQVNKLKATKGFLWLHIK